MSVTSGGTALSAEVRDGLRAVLPGVDLVVLDGAHRSGLLADGGLSCPFAFARAFGQPYPSPVAGITFISGLHFRHLIELANSILRLPHPTASLYTANPS